LTTDSFAPERKPLEPRTNYTVVAYLTFARRGAQESAENRAYQAESQQRLAALLRFLREHHDGVRSIRVYKHSVGGLIPTGRGHPTTQVWVEITRLTVFDAFRDASKPPGQLRDLVEGVLERVHTCSTEILYEVAIPEAAETV
jgi:hypothetical protein